MKSKEKCTDLDKDNRAKLIVAANQIENEVNDEDINRWEKTKGYVHNQLTNNELDDTNIHKLLSKAKQTNYNKILGTMIICSNNEFDVDYIKKYLKKLKDQNIPEQKIFIMCIRNYDYNILYNYILMKYGDSNE